MNRMFRPRIAATLCIALAAVSAPTFSFGQADIEQTRSYTARYQDEAYAYRATMFPHEVDGCKRLLQSRQSLRREDGFVEQEGADCNCDLLIDGMENVFKTPPAYGAEKMQAICTGPGVDGTERRLLIMRESLKRNPDYSGIGDVRG